MLARSVAKAVALSLLGDTAGADVYVKDQEGNAFVSQDFGSMFRLTSVYKGTVDRASVDGSRIEATDSVEVIFIEADCSAWHNVLGPGRFGKTKDGFAVAFNDYFPITFPDQVIPWPALETCALKP